MIKRGLIALVCMAVLSAAPSWAATYYLQIKTLNPGGTIALNGATATGTNVVKYVSLSATRAEPLVSPAAGYKVAAVKVNGTAIAVPGDGTTPFKVYVEHGDFVDTTKASGFRNPTVVVTFALAGSPIVKTWQLQVRRNNVGGTITTTRGAVIFNDYPVGRLVLKTYTDTAPVTVAVAPSAGYEVRSVTLNGVPVTLTGGSFSVEPASSAAKVFTVAVTFKPVTFTVSSGDGILPTSVDTMLGGSVVLMVSPPFDKNMVDAITVTGGGSAMTLAMRDSAGNTKPPFRGVVRLTIGNISAPANVVASYGWDPKPAIFEKCSASCHASASTPGVKEVYGKWEASAHAKQNPIVDCIRCHGGMPGNVRPETVSNTTFQVLQTVGTLTAGENYCIECHTPGHGAEGDMAACRECHVASGGDAHAVLPLESNATCLSSRCHGNPSLVKTITIPGLPNETVPLYVNAAAYAATTHGSQQCVSCHTDIQLTDGGHAAVPKRYGGWARFSQEQAIPLPGVIAAGMEDTRNYVTAASRSCSTTECHPAKSAFGSSPHATIGKLSTSAVDPALTAYAQAQGANYVIGKPWMNGDCNRCHATCGTCHFKSTISRLNTSADTLKTFWDNLQNGILDGWNENMTEYKMDWTTNVASHQFRTRSYFATDAEKVCEACHSGSYNSAEDAYYWKTAEHPVANETTVGVVQATSVSRYPQGAELANSGSDVVSTITNGSNTVHAQMTCSACHAAGNRGNIHAATGGEIRCTTCHDFNAAHASSPYATAIGKHIAGTYVEGVSGRRVACIGCHTFGLARDFELKQNVLPTSHDVFIDPVTGEVRPVVFTSGRAAAWYSHNWQKLNPGDGKLDAEGDCAKKCHYAGNLVGAGITR